MSRLVDWFTSNDNRFYGSFLLIMVALFGLLSIFWILAFGGFVVSAMFFMFYHTLLKRKSPFR